MRDSYSLYDAKAKFSAIVRRVREGHPVIVTVHGEPAVEIRAVSTTLPGIDSRLAQMAERGVLVRTELHPEKARARFSAIARRPGALKRFLDDRAE